MLPYFWMLKSDYGEFTATSLHEKECFVYTSHLRAKVYKRERVQCKTVWQLHLSSECLIPFFTEMNPSQMGIYEEIQGTVVQEVLLY